MLVAIHRLRQAIERSGVAASGSFLCGGELVTNFEQLPETSEQVVHYAAKGAGLVALSVVAESGTLLQRDRALVGIQLATDHTQQGALAGTIGGNQPGAFAELEPKADPLKEALAAVPKTQIGDFQ